MNRNALLSVLMVCVAASAFAQAPGIVLPPGASPQAPQDAGYQALIATCKTPPPARGGGPGGARGAGPPGGVSRSGCCAGPCTGDVPSAAGRVHSPRDSRRDRGGAEVDEGVGGQ